MKAFDDAERRRLGGYLLGRATLLVTLTPIVTAFVVKRGAGRIRRFAPISSSRRRQPFGPCCRR